MTRAAGARVRCAIYTRKSTDEGLDQSFNSLDAQREACEAYVRSQAGEGWRALPDQYDDGGFSGGNLDRPAMQRLLSDIDAGKVDVIVVYKVDRLTRSLMDFAKIVDRLDARGVSFVSVTQAFNTTTSMGRLTLNVLLSFAQFEREVTGERIRDKIAASKAKGIWMGGNVPLGYDLGDRRLVVNPVEAAQVQHIFERYLALGSGVALMKELRRDGIVSKRSVSRAGKERGGLPFSCGALYYLLQNRIYVGEIVHRGERHVGDQEAIVSEELFASVQEALALNRQKRREKPSRSSRCLLAGLACGPHGRPLATTFSYGRGGKLYRYYAIGSLDPAKPTTNARLERIPASRLEREVRDAVAELIERPLTVAVAIPFIKRVEVHRYSIQIGLKVGTLLEPHEPLALAVERLRRKLKSGRLVVSGSSIRLFIDKASQSAVQAVMTQSPSQSSTTRGSELLRVAHAVLEEHCMSPSAPEKHAYATAPSWQRQRWTMALGLIAPDLQKAIMRQSVDTTVERLGRRVPLAWADQRQMIA